MLNEVGKPSFLHKLITPFTFIKDALSHNGYASSKRMTMFISAMVLCMCLMILTGAIVYVLVKNPTDHKINMDIVLLYTALTVPIATLAGAIYVKKSEEIQATTDPKTKSVISNSSTTVTKTVTPKTVVPPVTSEVKTEVSFEG